MSFGETVSPVAAIQAILHEYPYSVGILRELLQNSDDAGATKQIFVLDDRDNPALIAYNDAQFHDADWEAIQSIHQSSKKTDTSKIGKYGVGFRACYHVTDSPQILSGSSFAILDPLHSKGMKIDYEQFRATDHRNLFDFFADIYEPTPFLGTAIRLPLRSSPSELSQRTVPMDELRQMVKDYIAEEMNISLLFLEKLKTIEIWEFNAIGKTSLAAWTKSKMPPPSTDQSPSLVISDTILSSGDTQCTWRVVQAQSSEDDAKSRLSKLASSDSVNHVMQKHKLRPDIRIAYPISSTEPTIGRLFTFLPLPSKTGFPVHIHALFALTSSRQGLRNPNETGIVQGSDNDILIKWNRLLFDHYIPQAWSHLLKSLAKGEIRGSIYATWPPRCSSITSGDGVYWQYILPKVYWAVIESGLHVWPTVSGQGETTYVELKSALIVAQGQVNADTLAVLSELGLTLVELPQDLVGLVDGSITKLTPSVAHARLQGQLGRFANLSRDQRAIVSCYLLSDKDIRKIFGLPLLPVLDGSFVSLDDRKKLLAPFVALESDEVVVFKASAGDAIPLDQLTSEVATLIREQGPSQANVDLLSPQSVIRYLSNASQPFSDGRLADFWNWLGGWHLKSELVELLKSNSSLYLIPTTNGPQAVPSPVFVVLRSADTSLLLEKLGLAFIAPTLPLSAIRLLNSHHILKDANDLNDLLAAVSLTRMPSLTDKEAESILNHVTAYYGAISSNNLSRLRQLPIFPVLVPEDKPCDQDLSNCSTTWRSINDINVKGISPMKLVPVVENTHFLDNSSIGDTSSPVMKKFRIRLMRDEEILLHALEHFPSQSKPLQAAFVSYIKRSQDRLPSLMKKRLQETQFLRTGCSTLRSPGEVIDPNSPLANLFSRGNENTFLPKVDDNYDRQLFSDLQALGLMKTRLTTDLICERISFISSNASSPEANTISRSLLALMNDASFSCSGLTIDSKMLWLPTQDGHVDFNSCINSGRQDTDLFDKVLLTLDGPISVSSSFKALLNWDKPLPLDVLTRQLDQVLEGPEPKSDLTKIRKIRNIIRELAGRQLQIADIQTIERVVAGRCWIPTKTGNLAPHSRAVFFNVPESSGFYEIGFSMAEQEIHRFLTRIGCQERPTATAIAEELTALREQPKGDGIIIQRAVQLLEMLPNSITEEELSSLLVPEEAGSLVSLTSGICYYTGTGDPSSDNRGTPIAHHLITEELAEKLKMNRLGLAEEDNIELGEKPITTIRNTLRQYDPEQFFTEFIANASDAKATQFSLLVDDHQGPTTKVFSEGMKAFQSSSLVVYNNGVFVQGDFKGIRETGIGGKRGKPNMIGHFGLGALSMFHFTEMAMIVSGSYVLLINPAKQHLSYRGRNSVLLPLQQVKSFYADHLEPLDGLFGFDLSSTEPYQGTLFRLPLRSQAHLSNNPVLTTSWDVENVQDMLKTQFDKLAHKSLLFTNLNRIEVLSRRNSQTTVLRTIESIRTLDIPAIDAPLDANITTFNVSSGQEKWLILSMPADVPTQLREMVAKKYDKNHFLPVQIAAALDDTRVSGTEYNLFCSLPLPITTSLPVHISAPLILEQERRNIRLDNLGQESEYNRWLLSSEVPRLYIILLERLLQKEGTNQAWWPGISSNAVDNTACRTVIESFWTLGMLGTTSSRVFAAKYRPGSPLTPKEAVLFSECRYTYKTISKVVALSEPLNIAEVPPGFYEPATKAELRVLDPPFIRGLLEDSRICQQLTPDEINAMLSYLHQAKTSLHGLSLLALEDGSLAPILEGGVFTTTYYVCEPAQNATWPPFRKDRLVHRDSSAKQYLLNKGYNVSNLSEAGIVELVEECIEPGDEIFGDEAHKTWVAAFWDARLTISPAKVSHLPLVPTLKPFYFISPEKINDPSVIVTEEMNAGNFDYNTLQGLGMTVVVTRCLPSALQEFVTKKKHSVFRSFLGFMNNKPELLALLQNLEPSNREELNRWVRSRLKHTPADCVDIACKLPVWPVQEHAGGNRLAALNDVVILHRSVPSEALRPFTRHVVIDWEDEMKILKKEPCSPKRITELLRVSAGDLLRPAELPAYKRLIRHLMDLNKIDGYALLVPNERSVLTPAHDLFERHELFIAAFRSTSHRLLSEDFQDLVQDLDVYGLQCRSRLDLSMFIACASAFNQDRGRNKRARSVTLYQYFNSLSLSHWRDSSRCSQLDDFKFIPRVDSQRPEYNNIDTIDYMADLPQDVLSPSQIMLPQFEPICWSQRGRTNPPPNATLCGTYQALGKPIGAEVVAHLKVLAEIGQEHGYCAGLLSDLKATYKWLNDNVEDIRHLIVQENTQSIFLNVSNPGPDKWVWHSASTLVIGLRDVRDIHDVKSFLGNYKELLKAAGVRKIHKVTAKAAPPTDKTAQFREKFAEMRKKGWGTDVTFNTMDDQYQVPPAHKAWLTVNSNHLWTTFITSGFQEAQQSNVGESMITPPEHFSSLCVREVVDWIYTGKLPESVTGPSNSDEELKTKLDLALDMLALSDYWQVTDLHEYLQTFIINAQDFINPYWVKDILENAEDSMATQLVDACKKYQEDNRSIVEEYGNT